MNIHWTTGRAILAILATGLLVLGVKCLLDGRREYEALAAARIPLPLDAAVDFSVTGEVAFPFPQVFSRSHAQAVVLRVPQAALTNQSPEQLLDGLAAQMNITDQDGNLVEAASVKIETLDPTDPGAIAIFHFAPFRRGNYPARISVTAGASALRGLPQRLESQHLLCGLEEMPGHIAIVAGVFSLVLGTLLGGAVLLRLNSAPRKAGASAEPDGSSPNHPRHP
ncbi:MAG: hypothetical protein ACK45B_06540 [Limisphaerales bacterium]